MKNTITIFSILLFQFSIFFAQEKQEGSLSFYISDAENGYGLRAEITLTNQKETFRLQTNELGHLLFNGDVGKYTITIAAPGHRSLNTHFFINNGASLKINAIMDRVTKTLISYQKCNIPTMEGYVTDSETGQPLDDVIVELTTENLIVKTNKDGFFSIAPTRFAAITNPTDQKIRSTISFTLKGYPTKTIEDLLIVPDKIKLKIALDKNGGVSNEKYIQHVLDGTRYDTEMYEKSLPEKNEKEAEINSNRSTSGCVIPSAIRVGTSCSCTNCSSVNVMSLQYYSESGIDNEWISSWDFESLAAGSVAYRSYGGWYVNNPVDANYDIASTTCNQVWGATIYSNAQSAAQATSGQIVTANGIDPARSEYSAENNYGGTSYNCSDCKAGGSGAYSCFSDNLCCGQSPAGHGRGMCQWGTQYWAQNGQNSQWIIDHYYIATIGYSICSANDITPPETQVIVPSAWATQNFTASFTDTDDSEGSGIEKSFYQVLEYTGTEWRANNERGFFSDNFDSLLHPDWTVAAGTWAINGGFLEQSDQANSNTNIYAPLKQSLSNRYLFNWKGRIEGTGTNRRAGFHFFCDSASQTNRGNSYFVWFRVDQSQLQIYKVTNNNFGAASFSAPATININTWYNYTVSYDRISGKMDVYINNNLIGSWIDSTPYATGKYISFRSGDCNYKVNDLKVYRSRPASVIVTVGPSASNDVRYQNPNPATPACRVKSITLDSSGNLSAVAAQDVNIDWTPPETFSVNDGTAADIDFTSSFTQLFANWTTSADTNSGILKYWYTVGTNPGAEDIIGWIDNGLNTFVTDTGLTLLPNQYYYYNLYSENGAGLFSSVCSSDGQMVSLASIPEKIAIAELKIYPNPFSSETNVDYLVTESAKIEISLTDVLGKKIILFDDKQEPGNYQMNINATELQLAKGMYFLKLKTDNCSKVFKIVMN